MAWRTSAWVRSVQPHTALVLGVSWKLEPRQFIRICSTRPVHEPQELAALVCFLTSSTVNRPCSRTALTMVPLHTPLQPQTSSESAMLAARSWPPVPASPSAFSPNTSWSRRSSTPVPSLISLKYQPPSPVSPYRQAPTSLSSRITSFLYRPPAGSESTISSVPSPPMKSPAENRSIPVTLSLVEATEPL